MEIWKKKYQVDYALLDTWEEKINFLKEILEKIGKKRVVAMRNPEAFQDFIVKKLNNARDQQANESTVKGQKSPEPIQKTIVIQNQDLQNKSIMKKSTGRVNKHNWYMFGKNFLI